jgi:glycosyltransferase involved in cell wall biosynthesis
MKISTIITSMNSAAFISKAIDSFLAQDYEPKQLVIIDGKSTDGSFEIIESYQKKYPQTIKWIKEKDSGISSGRNIALKHCNGDLIGFLGADDVLHKDFFKEMGYYISQNPNFDVIYGNRYIIDEKHSSFDQCSAIKFSKRNLLKHVPLAPGEAIYYRKELFDIFKFNEKNRATMDYEFNMALLSYKKRKINFFPVNVTAVFNVSYGNNISTRMAEFQKFEVLAIQLKYASSVLEKIRMLAKKRKFILKNLPKIYEILKKL